MPKFNNGIDLSSGINGIGGDNTYKQQLTSAPTRIEVNGMRTPGKLPLSSGGGALSNVNAGTVTGAALSNVNAGTVTGAALSNVNAGTVTGAVNGTLGIISGFN